MLDTLRRNLRYTSWPILAATLALMAIGITAISVAQQSDQALHGYAARQIAFACGGLAAFLAATVLPYRRLGRAAYWLFGATLVVLVMLVVPKVLARFGIQLAWINAVIPEIRGSRRWINLGFVQAQPSELAKLSFVILLAWYLRRGDHYRRLGGLVMPFVLTLVPMALILVEPDLGTALLFLPTLYFMLFMAGAKLRHLLGIVALGTALVLLPIPSRLDGGGASQARRNLAYWTFHRGDVEYAVVAAPLAKMQPHQLSRIEGWLRQENPAIILREDVRRERPEDYQLHMHQGYQLLQSKLVLGAGRVFGRGDWNETAGFFRMLPDDHTDFIFSVIGGQWGFAGCAALLLLYAIIFLFGIEIAAITYDPFGRLLAVGMLALLFSQICINVGMTMGLMPITGMTLPLVSYGGSSLVVNCAALGLLVNVGQRRPILLSRRPFEHGKKRERLAGPESPLANVSRRPGQGQ